MVANKRFGVVFLLALFCSISQAQVFRAAVVKKNITPVGSQQLIGYAARTSVGVHDSIYHRILVLDDGEREFFLVSSDICLVKPSVYDDVAAIVSQRFGAGKTEMWWTVTHTHSAPEVGPPGMPGVFLKSRYEYHYDTAYANFVVNLLLEGISEAREQLRAAKLGVGWGFSQANINRRGRDETGKTRLGMNPDAPVDNRIGMLKIEDAESGQLIATVANYAIHGTVLGAANRLISGDVQGMVASYVEEQSGAPLLFVNGAAGNIAPIYSVYDTPLAGHLDEFKAMLGNRILEALADIHAHRDSFRLHFGEVTVRTPKRPGLDWPVNMEAYKEDDGIGGEHVLLPIKFVKIGHDIALWSAPLELFCEVSMAIREASPFPYTFYFGYSNGWLGYLLTDSELAFGGYETTVTPFAPSAAGRLKNSVSSYLHGELLSKPYDEDVPSSLNVLELKASEGQGVGPSIKFMPEWDAFGWFMAGDSVIWEIDVPHSGVYEVLMDWSVSDKESGKEFTLTIGNHGLKAHVGKTGSWETFREAVIGNLYLASGPQRVVLTPSQTICKGALMDLRKLKLSPVK